MAISLEGLSNQELVGRLKQFVAKEQKLTNRIILMLAEMDRRRLYAELGYTSLFDYATRGLGYTRMSAQRRIAAARAMRHVPEVYDCLENGTLSLGVVEVVADVLTSSNARKLIAEVSGKSREEAQRVVAGHFPVDPIKAADRIEPIVVKRQQNSNYSHAGVTTDEVGNQFRISFTVSEQFKEKLERAGELLFSTVGPAGLEVILERVLDDYISRNCPAERFKRREARRERSLKAKGERILENLDDVQVAADNIVEHMPLEETNPARRRYPSAQLRDEVLERDGHQCTFVGRDGTRCCARAGLQIDHITPFGLCGLTELGNLRTTCKTHNLLAAREIYGDAYIDELIERNQPDEFGRPTVKIPLRQWNPDEKMLWG